MTFFGGWAKNPKLPAGKPPEHCPYCYSPNIRVKGRRLKKLETVRLYICRACDHRFTPSPRAVRNKTCALALTRLVPGLGLFDIKCAWFNENCYNEFFPRLLLPRPAKILR